MLSFLVIFRVDIFRAYDKISGTHSEYMLLNHSRQHKTRHIGYHFLQENALCHLVVIHDKFMQYGCVRMGENCKIIDFWHFAKKSKMAIESHD